MPGAQDAAVKIDSASGVEQFNRARRPLATEIQAKEIGHCLRYISQSDSLSLLQGNGAQLHNAEHQPQQCTVNNRKA
jgi:hypothetical protein